jgi:hypothetical protein
MATQRIPYSSHVELRLSIDGAVLDLAQVGPDFVILRESSPQTRTTTTARLDVIVDRRVATSQEVFLPYGIAAGAQRIQYF